MYKMIKIILATICICAFVNISCAQPPATTSKLSMGKVDPYELSVTYNKTSHIIFPSPIRYVDLGSEYLIAGKAADAENVLRVKAAIKDFSEETNFSVITEDGRFYSFNVVYNAQPTALSYDIMQMQQSSGRIAAKDVLFEELGKNPPSLTQLLMDAIYKQDKKMIRHISSESYGIEFRLKGIFIHNGLLYFHTAIKNKSNLPFTIDFVSFKIIDKKVAKRTAIQEKPLQPLRIYKPLDEISGNATAQNIFLLDQFSLADNKILQIEIFEKNGGRQQTLKLDNADLIKAKLIEDMHVRIH